MVSTRKFTKEEQQILEDFIKSDKIYDLVNDKIHDTKKCRKWVNENSKIKDALNKNFNNKSELNIKDKFLWILSDIINCQLDEKAKLHHKQINIFSNLKEILIILGICGEIKGIENVICPINYNKQLEEMVKIFLNYYSPQKKNVTPLNRVAAILKETDKYNKQSTIKNKEGVENKYIKYLSDLISYVEGKEVPEGFEELEKDNMKRKYENNNNNMPAKKLAIDTKTCVGEIIVLSDSE